MDTTSIYNALSRYVKASVELGAAEYELEDPGWAGKRRFGILYVAEHSSVVLPSCDATFSEGGGTVTVVHRGDILVRRGAQTCRADQADLDRLLSKRRDERDDHSVVHSTPLLDNLPGRDQIGANFVGRAAELAALWEWFRNPDRRLWLLAGDGGKEKTAIAYEFATQVKSEAPAGIDCVLWLSAKRRRFVEGAVLPIGNPDFWNMSSLLNAIAAAYGFLEYVQLPLEERRKRVLDLLDQLPALLVADDIDSLDAQSEDAIEFLVYNAAQTCSKILITSRRVPFGLGTSTEMATRTPRRSQRPQRGLKADGQV